MFTHYNKNRFNNQWFNTFDRASFALKKGDSSKEVNSPAYMHQKTFDEIKEFITDIFKTSLSQLDINQLITHKAVMGNLSSYYRTYYQLSGNDQLTDNKVCIAFSLDKDFMIIETGFQIKDFLTYESQNSLLSFEETFIAHRSDFIDYSDNTYILMTKNKKDTFIKAIDFLENNETGFFMDEEVDCYQLCWRIPREDVVKNINIDSEITRLLPCFLEFAQELDKRIAEMKKNAMQYAINFINDWTKSLIDNMVEYQRDRKPDFKNDFSFKVKPDFPNSCGRYFLDNVSGSYDESAHALVYHLLIGFELLEDVMSKQYLAEANDYLDENADSIYMPDYIYEHDTARNILDWIDYQCINFIANQFIKNNIDASDIYDEYLEA